MEGGAYNFLYLINFNYFLVVMSVRLFEPVAMMNGLCITPSPTWDIWEGG